MGRSVADALSLASQVEGIYGLPVNFLGWRALEGSHGDLSGKSVQEDLPVLGAGDGDPKEAAHAGAYDFGVERVYAVRA